MFAIEFQYVCLNTHHYHIKRENTKIIDRKMSSIRQNIVLLVFPPNFSYDISWKGGNMILNRFCIDEEMANESSGVFDCRAHIPLNLDFEGTGISNSEFIFSMPF